MRTIDKKEVARKALALAIVKNRAQLVALLRKYGITIDTSNSDDELIVAILTANNSKERFRKELSDILAKTSTTNKNNFVGEDGFFNLAGGAGSGVGSLNDLTGITTPTTTDPTTTKTKTALGSYLSQNLGGLINQGLSTLSTSLTNKQNQKLADAALKIEAEKTKQAALLAAGAGSAGQPSKGLSTGAKIGIAVGVLALVGTIVYFVVKKK